MLRASLFLSFFFSLIDEMARLFQTMLGTVDEHLKNEVPLTDVHQV